MFVLADWKMHSIKNRCSTTHMNLAKLKHARLDLELTLHAPQFLLHIDDCTARHVPCVHALVYMYIGGACKVRLKSHFACTTNFAAYQ